MVVKIKMLTEDMICGAGRGLFLKPQRGSRLGMALHLKPIGDGVSAVEYLTRLRCNTLSVLDREVLSGILCELFCADLSFGRSHHV
jgi:hypothetical protein